MKNNNYIHIDSCIKKFKYNIEIVDFISPIPDGDVPQPYTIDKNGNIIMIYQEVILDGIENVNDPILYLEEHPINNFKKINIKIIKCSTNY